MDTKLDAVRILQDLSPAHWAKGGGLGKEVGPALDEAGVQAALKSLAKAVEALDLALFSTAKLKTSAEATARLASAQAAVGKELKAVVAAARSAETVARKALAAFKARKLDSKGAPAAAQTIADAAGRFAVALPAQADSAVTALEDLQADLLAQDEEKAAKASGKDAKDGKGGKAPDAKAAAATLALTPAFQLLRKKAIEGLRIVKNTPAPDLTERPVQYLVGLGSKACRVFIARSVSSSHRKLVKGLMPGEATVKFFVGTIVWEAKAFTFVGAQVPGGFAKKVQRGLLEQTKSNFRIRARRLDGGGDVEDAAGDADPDQLDLDTGEALPAKAPAHGPGGHGAAVPTADARIAALRKRLSLLKPELDAVVAAGGPRAAALKKGADEIEALLKAGKDGGAKLLLARLEDVVFMEAGKAGPGSSDGGAGTDGGTDAGSGATGGSGAGSGPRQQAEAILSQITALVLGGLENDAARKALNGELKKLQAAFDKAAKAGKPAAQDKAYAAVRDAAAKVLERGQVTNTGEDFAAAKMEPLFAQAAKSVTSLPMGRAREVMLAELESLRADAARYEAAGDATALQSIVQPRLAKLARVSGAIPALAAALMKNLSDAEAAITPLDATASADLRARLAALKEQAANDFPAGHTLDEIDAEDKIIGPAAAVLVSDARVLGATLTRRAEVAKLRKRLDGLKTRLDKTTEAGQPAFIDKRQKTIQELLANFGKFEAKDDPKSCEVLFSNIGAQLDAVEAAKRNHIAARKAYDDARAGGIAQAKAAKLVPASLATLRNRSLDAEGARIEKLLDGGKLPKATKAVADWLKQARTWAKAPAAYNNMRSGHPVKGAMKDLIGEPGGGAVFDAIVADLPEDTSTETMTDAMDARFGVQVSQFNHRKPGQDKAPNTIGKQVKTRPDAPQKNLKDLYRILRMVPVRDVKTIERITDYTEETGATDPSYFSPGVFNDDIVMMAGRPTDADTHPTGDPAKIVPPGETADPRAAIPGGAPIIVNYYTHTVLHEVAHGLDDEHGVMKKHGAEAGWESHSVGHVAEVVARFYSYDAGYVKDLLKNKGTPPAKRPKRPKDVKTDKAWDDARKDVEQWAAQSVETASPWGKPANAKANAIGGRVYHEAYEGDWVSYHLAARRLGISDYQFRSSAEWFADLYALFYLDKLNPSHPSAGWLEALKAEAEA